MRATWSTQGTGRRRFTRRLCTAVFALGLLATTAESCDEGVRIIVQPDDATPPESEIKVTGADGVTYTGPATSTLSARPGQLAVSVRATDLQSGISGVELFFQHTETTCAPSMTCTSSGVVSLPLPGSFVNERVPAGTEVRPTATVDGTIDASAFVPTMVPSGTSFALRLDIWARLTNNLGRAVVSPVVTLNYREGFTPPNPACPSFTLSWNWSFLPSSNGDFSDAPNCPAGSNSKVSRVDIRLQFPPGTWTEQAVTVSHGPVSEALLNGMASHAFDGLDPAGTWFVRWGGNVTIRPTGISLIVQTSG